MKYFIGDWVFCLNKGRIRSMDWVVSPTIPDFLSVRSALANTARKETSHGMAFIVKHGRNDFSDPMCEVVSQTNTILICLFIACCTFWSCS